MRAGAPPAGRMALDAPREGVLLIAAPSAAVVTTRNQFFRWTPRTARLSIIYAVVIPGFLTYVAYSTKVSSWSRPANLNSGSSAIMQCTDANGTCKGKFDFRAKRRGDLVSEY